MIQIMVAGQIYHCRFCHKDFRYRGEVTGCSQDCCHGADVMLTPDEVWKEYKEKEYNLNAYKIKK